MGSDDLVKGGNSVADGDELDAERGGKGGQVGESKVGLGAWARRTACGVDCRGIVSERSTIQHKKYKICTHDAPLAVPQLKKARCFSLEPSWRRIENAARSSGGVNGLFCETNSFVTSKKCLGVTQNLLSCWDHGDQSALRPPSLDRTPVQRELTRTTNASSSPPSLRTSSTTNSSGT